MGWGVVREMLCWASSSWLLSLKRRDRVKEGLGEGGEGGKGVLNVPVGLGHFAS